MAKQEKVVKTVVKIPPLVIGGTYKKKLADDTWTFMVCTRMKFSEDDDGNLHPLVAWFDEYGMGPARHAAVDEALAVWELVPYDEVVRMYRAADGTLPEPPAAKPNPRTNAEREKAIEQARREAATPQRAA